MMVFLSGVVLVSDKSEAKGVIQFPDEELASDYVFPVFDQAQAVMRRNVSLKHRFEFKMLGGLRADEPIYQKSSLGGSLSFYFTEFSGIGVSGLFFLPGFSKNGRKLQDGIEQEGKEGEVDFFVGVELAPVPLLAVFLNYQFTPLYGKISITKKIVFNFALSSSLGGGALGYKHDQNSFLTYTPAAHWGVGQRFYLNRYVALEGGVDLLFYHGPSPIMEGLKFKPNEPKPQKPEFSRFKKDLFFRLLAQASLTFLF